ncbi:hypothetical protein F5887DRAFT_1173657 [Amanita rubescens]|nr:hypothetical protein F5887DRAFT_1173657 [Amanita rubescens]
MSSCTLIPMLAAYVQQAMAAPAPAPAPVPNFALINEEWDTISQSTRQLHDQLSLLPQFMQQFNIHDHLQQTRNHMDRQFEQVIQVLTRVSNGLDGVVIRLGSLEQNSFRRSSNVHLGFNDPLYLPVHGLTGGEVQLAGHWNGPRGVCINTIEEASNDHMNDLVQRMGIQFPDGMTSLKEKRGLESWCPTCLQVAVSNIGFIQILYTITAARPSYYFARLITVSNVGAVFEKLFEDDEVRENPIPPRVHAEGSSCSKNQTRKGPTALLITLLRFRNSVFLDKLRVGVLAKTNSVESWIKVIGRFEARLDKERYLSHSGCTRLCAL